MGLGPIESSRQALARAGMTIGDVDVVEINEAFAAQVIPSARGHRRRPVQRQAQPARRRDRPRPPVRHDRGADPGHAAERPAHPGPDDRARDHVHRRRPGHGHDRGAAVMTASRDRALPAETRKHNGHHPAPRVPEPRKPQDMPAAEPKVPPEPEIPPQRSGLFGRAAGALRFVSRLAAGPAAGACCSPRPASASRLLRIALGRSQVEPGKGDHALRRSRRGSRTPRSGRRCRRTCTSVPGWTMWSPASAWRAWPPSGCASRWMLAREAHGAYQLLLDQPGGGQALLRHRRPQRLERGRQPGPRHGAQPRPAVDGRPQAVQARREHRDLARRGHPPVRGLRADPVHAAA